MDRLISEFEVIRTIEEYVNNIFTKNMGDLVKDIKAIPSVEPKTGHWIIIDDCEKFIAKCSECGRIEDSRMISKYPYCHCGAKMD